MKRAVAFVGWWLLTGCGASGGQIASLEAELRRVRAVQEQQATQIEQLQHRVILTEDAARDARRAVEHSGRLATVRLGSDPPAVEPIRVDASARPEPAEAAEPESAPRPVLRATRSDRMPPPGGFAVREGDRLPVAPVPPLSPSPTTPTPAAPTTAPPPPPRTTPAGPRSEAAPPALQEGAGTLDPQAARAYDDGLALVRARRCDEALERFAAFLVRWPGHPHADNAMYWRGHCLLQGGELQRGIAELEGLVRRFPVGNKVPDALFTLRSAYERAGDGGAAERAARRLTTDYPDSDAARRLRDERQTR